jgi:hypothetical protein
MGGWGIGGMGKDRSQEGLSVVSGQWALRGKVSKAAWMHDCMVDTDFKHLPEGQHLLNLNLFPFVSLRVTSWLIF